MNDEEKILEHRKWCESTEAARVERQEASANARHADYLAHLERYTRQETAATILAGIISAGRLIGDHGIRKQALRDAVELTDALRAALKGES